MHRVGSGAWSRAEVASLSSAAALWSAHQGSPAGLTAAAEEQISRWRHGVAALDTDALDAATEELVLGWVRRALYRDLGLAALSAGNVSLARSLLQEAAGGSPRPGDGRDPVLVAGLASAHFHAGELSSSIEILSDIASQLGWEFAAIPAELIRRLAVSSPSRAGTDGTE